MNWRDCVKADVGKIRPDIPWWVVERDGWRGICLAIWAHCLNDREPPSKKEEKNSTGVWFDNRCLTSSNK